MRVEEPKYTTKVITENGLNNDIIKAIHKSLPAATKEAAKFAYNFNASTRIESARKIWEFLRTLNYQKDPAGKQLIKLPNRLIHTEGDCKSFSLLTGAILQNLKMPVIFRYASYSPTDKTPSHVYTLTKDEKGKMIIIDGVYNHFNKEVPYQYKHDYKMEIAVLNGTPTGGRPLTKLEHLENALHKVPPGGFIFNVISNEIARQKGQSNAIRYNATQLQKYLQRLKKRRSLTPVNSWVNKILGSEINAIETGNFTGSIKLFHKSAEISGIEAEIGKLSLKKIAKGFKRTLKKISPKNLFKGVKAVAFVVPRKAFQALVALNVRGIANRMAKAPGAMIKIWEKFGGKASGIEDAIRRGVKKKPLLGAGKRVKQIKGINGIDYCTNDNIKGIGEPVTVAAIITAATPILLAVLKGLKGAGIPDTEGKTDELGKEATQSGGGSILDNIKDFATNAFGMATSSGIIPERPLSTTEQQVDNALPESDLDQTKTGFKISPLVIGAVAGAAYLLFSKKGK